MLILAWLSVGLPSNVTQYHVAKYPSTLLPSSVAASQGRFPRKIWQTWKHAPPSFAGEELERARTWTEKNPEWRWEVLTDANELEYVEHHFWPNGFNRPDIIDFFRTASIPIIKADLLRYLVMYVEGGLYTDIDVEALKSIPEFIPRTFDEAEIDMVIGIENDEPKFKNHPILGPVARNFCQWTFLCKPQLPFLIKMVENAVARLHDLAKEQGVPISELTLDFNQVIRCTGPEVFTDVILQYMNEQRIQGPPITWDNFHRMDEATLVGRILVLPVKAFAAGQTHSRSGTTHEIHTALVKHHYSVSNWTSRHSRYKHPVYGEVEECLFDEACVDLWDRKVKAYEDFQNKGKLN
ncbi:hypothetical protein NM208_g9879 [Fusarium decemcellulare]|uniref:Uncharacterized protein n=2 Tax=Fusarium decemcellulare TaxID=57161 RepID=A0ACC1RK62_9HYPO|nr:hypothetical protein NM208_g13514 [Fusarium decemcellulare]KAJ3529176.1 hypothetical protein NM208_g9879 [Fusarium decemcellulare]